MLQVTSDDILQFWFSEIDPAQWWKKDTVFDEIIHQRFVNVHAQARAGELVAWRKTAQGSLAEIIILDQFSRNIWRDQSESFAYDGMALVLAQQAIAKQFDQQLATAQRVFMYLPLMHSESLIIHDQALVLFASDPAMAFNLEFEHRHRNIIVKFGRYPHRNSVLGRQSTTDELAFLAQPGSSF